MTDVGFPNYISIVILFSTNYDVIIIFYISWQFLQTTEKAVILFFLGICS